MGLYKLNWLPGHPYLNVNLINYNCIATAVAMQSWMKFFQGREISCSKPSTIRLYDGIAEVAAACNKSSREKVVYDWNDGE